MSNLWITVEVAPGCGIESACADAVALSKRLGITVWFNFNGVRCLADERTDPQRLESAWNDALLSSYTHKVASDRDRA